MICYTSGKDAWNVAKTYQYSLFSLVKLNLKWVISYFATQARKKLEMWLKYDITHFCITIFYLWNKIQ